GALIALIAWPTTAAAQRLPPLPATPTSGAPCSPSTSLSPPSSAALSPSAPRSAMPPKLVAAQAPQQPQATPANVAAAFQEQGPVLEENQPGNVERSLGGAEPENIDELRSPVLDPDQPGNLDLRLDTAQRRRQTARGARTDELPRVRLSGFLQLDDGLFSQT